MAQGLSYFSVGDLCVQLTLRHHSALLKAPGFGIEGGWAGGSTASDGMGQRSASLR